MAQILQKTIMNRWIALTLFLSLLFMTIFAEEDVDSTTEQPEKSGPTLRSVIIAILAPLVL
jgi:hypothetical protein